MRVDEPRDQRSPARVDLVRVRHEVDGPLEGAFRPGPHDASLEPGERTALDDAERSPAERRVTRNELRRAGDDEVGLHASSVGMFTPRSRATSIARS